MTSPSYFSSSKRLIGNTRKRVTEELFRRKAGKRVAGYDATAKATKLLPVCGFDIKDLDFVADTSRWKQGLEMPVSRLPIRLSSEIYENNVACVLILAWNVTNEIMQEHKAFEKARGRFVVAI